jgi:hypothetical protein
MQRLLDAKSCKPTSEPERKQSKHAWNGRSERMNVEKPPYEFEEIAQQLIKVLLKSAEDNVLEAQNLLASTKALSEGIENQIRDHATMLNAMTGRIKTFGQEILDAHKKYLNGVDNP